MLHRIVAAAVVALGLVAGPALACPKSKLEPRLGSIHLGAGFTPDPNERHVIVGGPINLRNCFSGGAGYVHSQPDYSLYWTGESEQLTIAVETQTAGVLLINAPDLSWHFTDYYRDSGDYLRADVAVIFRNPIPGRYDIWIGSHDGARRNPAWLVLTEFTY